MMEMEMHIRFSVYFVSHRVIYTNYVTFSTLNVCVSELYEEIKSTCP